MDKELVFVPVVDPVAPLLESWWQEPAESITLSDDVQELLEREEAKMIYEAAR